MSRPTPSDIDRLLSDVILPFYLVKRDMRVPIGRRRLETSTEHSWALSVIACALAPKVDPTLDVGKVAQFALVHDLVELHAGDTTPFGSLKKVRSKDKREAAALKKIAAQTAAFPWIAETIKEYERRETPEALFVWAADKYVTLLTRHKDNGAFYRSQKLTHAAFSERIAGNRAKAHAHAAIGDYYDKLRADIDARPDHFYQKET